MLASSSRAARHTCTGVSEPSPSTWFRQVLHTTMALPTSWEGEYSAERGREREGEREREREKRERERNTERVCVDDIHSSQT